MFQIRLSFFGRRFERFGITPTQSSNAVKLGLTCSAFGALGLGVGLVADLIVRVV